MKSLVSGGKLSQISEHKGSQIRRVQKKRFACGNIRVVGGRGFEFILNARRQKEF